MLISHFRCDEWLIFGVLPVTIHFIPFQVQVHFLTNSDIFSAICSIPLRNLNFSKISVKKIRHFSMRKNFGALTNTRPLTLTPQLFIFAMREWTVRDFSDSVTLREKNAYAKTFFRNFRRFLRRFRSWVIDYQILLKNQVLSAKNDGKKWNFERKWERGRFWLGFSHAIGRHGID